MERQNNKKIASKTSFKNIKDLKKPLRIKEPIITSARTPRSGVLNIDLKKHRL